VPVCSSVLQAEKSSGPFGGKKVNRLGGSPVFIARLLSTSYRVNPAHQRAAWITADQAVSSLTNLVLAVLVAREATVAAFGVFALVYASYLFAIEFIRALVLEPLVISLAGDRTRVKILAPAAVGAALTVSLLLSAVCLAVGVFAPTAMRSGFWILTVGLPGLIVQDACRAVLLADHRPRAAFINDFMWGAVLISGAVLLGIFAQVSAAGMIALWAITGAMAGVVGLIQASVPPAVMRTREWLRRSRSRGPYFLLDFLVDSAALHLSVFLVGALAGLHAVGAFNAARVAMGPVGVMILAVAMVITSEGKRLSNRPAKMRVFVRRVGAAVFALGVGWGLFLQMAPSAVGESLLGDSFEAAKPLLVPMGIYIGLRGAMSAARIALRVLKPGMAAVALQACTAVLTIAAVVVGIQLAGASGAVWALVLVAILATALWWRGFGQASQQAEVQTVTTV
jgi:O-antigen/teichoic acid export membrane protein